jgi:hypothetical protein
MRIRARPAVGPASGKIVQATGSSSRFGSETKQHFADSHQVVFTGSYRQCVVRNAKLSQCETVRNVSHGLRRSPKRAKCAKLVPAQAVRMKLFSAQAVRAKSLVAAVRLTAIVAAMSDADAPAHKKRKAGGRAVDEKIWKHFKQITLPPDHRQITLPPDKECKAGM